MRLFTNFICLLVLILFLGCKAKTEQLKSEEAVEIEVTNSTVTTTVEEVPTPEVKTTEKKVQTTEKKETVKPAEPLEQKKETYKVSFLEIGSKNCIPCKMMQPIMKEIADEYKGVVKVEFYDLMDDREIGPQYNIRVMPTQVFLDANGKEFFRHEGFYPKAELAKMLDEYLAKLPK